MMPSRYISGDIYEVMAAEIDRFPNGRRPVPHELTVRQQMNYMGAEMRPRDALLAAEGTCPPGCEAHHIVPKDLDKAQPARDILEQVRIPINDVRNLVFLPRDKSTWNADLSMVHDTVHTKEYCEYLYRILSDAKKNEGPLGVEAVLAQIKINLYEASMSIPGGDPLRGSRTR